MSDKQFVYTTFSNDGHVGNEENTKGEVEKLSEQNSTD